MRKQYFLNLIFLLGIIMVPRMTMAAEAPFLAPIANQTATLGVLFTYDVNALYADPPETYELLAARPGMTINPSTGLISWTPADASDGGVVTVRAFNSAGQSVRTFLIYLTDAIVCSDNLISYWKLDEPTGSLFQDFQGGYTATSLTPLADTAGKVGRAKHFSPLGQSDQFAYVSDVGQYDFPRSGGFSVSLWFRYSGQFLPYSNNQVLVARGDPSPGADRMAYLLMVDVTSGSPRITWQLRPTRDETPKTFTPNVTLVTNQWYHVVAVYQGNPDINGLCTMRLYINNQKFSTQHIFGPADFVAESNEFDLNIGFWAKYPSNTYAFNGSMDEVLVLNEALSDIDVGAIYNDGQTGLPHCRPGNYYPLITSTPATSATQGTLYTYTFAADDYDGDPLTLSAEIIPDWLNFNPATGVLSGTPDNDAVGDNDVRLMATDGTTDVFQEFTIVVANINDPPEFTSTPELTGREGTAYTYFVSALDPDGDALTFTGDVIPSWLQFNAQTKVLVGIPTRDDVGPNPVKISVNDGQLTVSQEFTINVASDNNVPVITSIPPTLVDNYGQYSYQITAYDVDAGDVLTYAAETIPAWLNFDPATHILSGIPQKQHVGDHAVALTVSDSYDEARQEFTITVRDVNTAPVVLSDPADTAKLELLYAYALNVIDHEGDNLTFSGTLVPAWLTFDPVTRVLSGVPTSANLGDNNVIITISDGVFTVNHQFVIKVVPRWGVGIESVTGMVARVYPNPAQDFVNFEFDGEVSRIEIADLTGKILFNRTIEKGEFRTVVDVSDLNKGIYIFKVHHNNQQQTGKLIIN